MNGKANLYLLLAIAGAIVPLALFGVYFADEGFDLGGIVDRVFDNPITAAVMADVTISSFAFWVWMFGEAPRVGVSPWPFVAGNLLIGLCFALPLFLYFRERRGSERPA